LHPVSSDIGHEVGKGDSPGDVEETLKAIELGFVLPVNGYDVTIVDAN